MFKVVILVNMKDLIIEVRNDVNFNNEVVNNEVSKVGIFVSSLNIFNTDVVSQITNIQHDFSVLVDNFNVKHPINLNLRRFLYDFDKDNAKGFKILKRNR